MQHEPDCVTRPMPGVSARGESAEVERGKHAWNVRQALHIIRVSHFKGQVSSVLASLAQSISRKALSKPLLPLTAPRSSGKCFSRILFSCPSAVLLQHAMKVNPCPHHRMCLATH
jgi:hypothetical protein